MLAAAAAADAACASATSVDGRLLSRPSSTPVAVAIGYNAQRPLTNRALLA